MPQYKVSLLPAAFADLDEIFDYILADSPGAAPKMLERIIESLVRLAAHPRSGSPLFERSLTKFRFRMVVVSPYIAFYRIVGQEVIVYRVLHGARDYAHLLQRAGQQPKPESGYS
jgi:plasmid stabilization system protein ParE